MLGPVSQGRLKLVHPKLAGYIVQLDNQMSESLGVTQGLRTDDEQDALFAQGRLPVDQVNALRAKVGWAPIQASDNLRPVTNAKPGYSYHGFGLAVDVVPFDSAMHPDWNETHPVWQELIQKGEALGLTSGTSWKDEPHFQWVGDTGWPATPTDEVRELYRTGGLQAVWQVIGGTV